uniref:Uncharacterized protein n=1 Tax=Cucumis melo TaxID=3656 RepID=A0A9I9CUG9_CUCME
MKARLHTAERSRLEGKQQLEKLARKLEEGKDRLSLDRTMGDTGGQRLTQLNRNSAD